MIFVAVPRLHGYCVGLEIPRCLCSELGSVVVDVLDVDVDVGGTSGGSAHVGLDGEVVEIDSFSIDAAFNDQHTAIDVDFYWRHGITYVSHQRIDDPRNK